MPRGPTLHSTLVWSRSYIRLNACIEDWRDDISKEQEFSDRPQACGWLPAIMQCAENGLAAANAGSGLPRAASSLGPGRMGLQLSQDADQRIGHVLRSIRPVRATVFSLAMITSEHAKCVHEDIVEDFARILTIRLKATALCEVDRRLPRYVGSYSQYRIDAQPS